MNEEPIGLHASRLSSDCDNPREVAFVEQWHQEQKHADMLARLLEVSCSVDDPEVVRVSIHCGPYKRPLGVPTDRDRIVVETVLQWLGSNVGLSFVHEALKRVGYTVLSEREAVESAGG